jgi:hypothetical protein
MQGAEGTTMRITDLSNLTDAQLRELCLARNIDRDHLLFNWHSDYKEGYCMACDKEPALVPREARGVKCRRCGEPAAYGRDVVWRVLQDA